MSTPTDTKPEENPEPVEPTPTEPIVQWTDENGVVHVDHAVHTDCVGGCYQDVKA